MTPSSQTVHFSSISKNKVLRNVAFSFQLYSIVQFQRNSIRQYEKHYLLFQEF
jgi:hypothetical protein